MDEPVIKKGGELTVAQIPRIHFSSLQLSSQGVTFASLGPAIAGAEVGCGIDHTNIYYSMKTSYANSRKGPVPHWNECLN
jgi:hypothetical protein